MIQSSDDDRTVSGPAEGAAYNDVADEVSPATYLSARSRAEPDRDYSSDQNFGGNGEETALVASQSVDLMSDTAQASRISQPDDPFIEFENISRKDIMRMATDYAMRFYQAVIIKDNELLPIEEGARTFSAVLQHIVMGLSQTLTDEELGARFGEHARHQNREDPWVLAVRRELYRIERARGEG